MNGYNFTQRVRLALMRARQEALALRHNYVGTEHILLGLIGEADSIAASVLSNAGLDVSRIRASLMETVRPGRDAPATSGGVFRSVTSAIYGDRSPEIPYTSRAKKALELAMVEARELGHSHVGSEHMLIGLLREEKGIAAQVLHTLGLTAEAARSETLAILRQTSEGEAMEDRAVIVTVVMERPGGEIETRKFSSPSEAARYLRHFES